MMNSREGRIAERVVVAVGTVRENKKLLKEYLRKNEMGNLGVSARGGTEVITVLGWPRMQGQGAEAAGWMEVKWGKLVDFAKKNGFEVSRGWGY